MRRSIQIVLAAAAVALAVAGCSGAGDGAQGGGGGQGDQAATAGVTVAGAAIKPAQDRSGAGGDGGDSPVAEPSGGAGTALSRLQLPSVGPHVIQIASLRVSVARDGFEQAAEQARLLAAGLGGFVVSSTASQGKGGKLVRGSVVLRVPERSYARAMSGLVRLGRVEGREESGEDVSQEFVDLESRARHLEAVERQLLELLERARTVAAALAVQSQLNAVQLELEQVRGRLRYLEDQTAFATISVTIRERLPVAPVEDDGWGIVEAWRDGARAFVHVSGRAFVVIAAAAPLLVLLAVAVVAGRARRRKAGFRWGFSRQ